MNNDDRINNPTPDPFHNPDAARNHWVEISQLFSNQSLPFPLPHPPYSHPWTRATPIITFQPINTVPHPSTVHTSMGTLMHPIWYNSLTRQHYLFEAKRVTRITNPTSATFDIPDAARINQVEIILELLSQSIPYPSSLSTVFISVLRYRTHIHGRIDASDMVSKLEGRQRHGEHGEQQRAR